MTNTAFANPPDPTDFSSLGEFLRAYEMFRGQFRRDRPLSTREVAQQLGLRESSWRSRVSRGTAPAPDGYFDGRTPYWWQSTVDQYVRERRERSAND